MRPVIPPSYHPMLLALASAKPKVRAQLLQCLDAGTIQVLGQIVANILQGNIPLHKNQRRRMRKYKRVMSILRNKYSPIEHKREALIQQGGFLPLLLPIISSIAGALISKAIK